jgi:hypothetical protein
MKRQMVGQPTAKDRLTDGRSVLRTGGRRWQAYALVAKEGLVPIRGQSPALASAQKIAGSV